MYSDLTLHCTDGGLISIFNNSRIFDFCLFSYHGQSTRVFFFCLTGFSRPLEVIYTHKAILLPRCAKLQSLKDVKTVQVPFVKAAIFPIILYLYSGIFSLSAQHAEATWEAVKYLEVTKLSAQFGMGHGTLYVICAFRISKFRSSDRSFLIF